MRKCTLRQLDKKYKYATDSLSLSIQTLRSKTFSKLDRFMNAKKILVIMKQTSFIIVVTKFPLMLTPQCLNAMLKENSKMQCLYAMLKQF
jgi:hypothetical protein